MALFEHKYVYGYGEGGYGTIPYGGIRNMSLQRVVNGWENAAITIDEGSNMYNLMEALSTELNRIETEIEAIYDQRFLSSASDEELEKMGDIVNVHRREGETDKALRKRIRVNMFNTNTTTNYDDFATITYLTLGQRNNVDITLDLDNNPATVVIDTTSNVIDNTPLSQSEIIELLESSVPAGHEVQISIAGSFELKSDTYSPGTDTGLVDDQDTTGGTIEGPID